MESHNTCAGDIGRRAAWRRIELGLSQREVAERAGMHPGYVGYFEEHSAYFTREALYRLARALDTTPDRLLGADTDTPPGAAATAVREPRMRVLTSEQCLALIRPGGVGRVAFTQAYGAAPVVLPVNYAVHDGAVVLRTAAAGTIARQGSGPMSFQVDRFDGLMSEGWSVLAVGRAHQVVDPAERAALGRLHRLRPWAGGDRDAWVRIDPERFTGRRIGRSPSDRMAGVAAHRPTSHE